MARFTAALFPVLSTWCSVLSTWYLVPSLPLRTPQSALTLLLLALLGPFTHAAEPSDYADRLTSLAAKCDELGLPEQATISRTWIIPRHPGRQYLFLPETADATASKSTAPKSTAPEAARHWHRRFLELRREQAAQVFAAAKQQLETGNAPRAYQLVFETLHEDPDHAEARRILGYERRGSEWRFRGQERPVATPARLPHPKLGWPARYLSLETPHFSIVSNHSSKEILEAGQQLEKLHTLWQQVFFRFWSTTEALAARFAGANEPLAPEQPKLRVVLFKNREQYAGYVASAHPKAATTLGLYDDDQRIAYFFAGDTSVYPTWYHEATHQLFHEYAPLPATRSVSEGKPGSTRNFWALEAAALYMESLAEHTGFWTVGGCESDRLQLARYRVLSGDLDLPLARLTSLSRDDIQMSDDIGRIYTQAAGLAHFLNDGEQGKYRDNFCDYLTAIYQGRDSPDLLSQLTKQSPQQLDNQYRAYLDVTDADLAGIPSPQNCQNLSLSRTRITDAGLAHFAGTKNLKWLDLTLTAATDAGLKNFASNRNLKQLFLEGSQITEGSAPLLTTFKQLEELDLDALPFSAEAKKRLRAALPKLD